MHENLVAVLPDFFRKTLRRKSGVAIDDDGIVLAVDIDVHPGRGHIEAIFRTRINDAVAAIWQRLQPVDLCIGGVLSTARPLRIDLAVFKTQTGLRAPGIPVLNIARSAIPPALHEGRPDIEEEEAGSKIDEDGGNARQQAVSLHETAIENGGMRGRQPLAVGGVENEAGRHQAAPRPNSKD